jgi:hypothetical protein
LDIGFCVCWLFKKKSIEWPFFYWRSLKTAGLLPLLYKQLVH